MIPTAVEASAVKTTSVEAATAMKTTSVSTAAMPSTTVSATAMSTATVPIRIADHHRGEQGCGEAPAANPRFVKHNIDLPQSFFRLFENHLARGSPTDLKQAPAR
jgi:hypothetical protein